LGTIGVETDSDANGGWTATFDVGALSADATLTVVAYDSDGYASDAWAGTVHVVPFPTWLGNADGDDYFAGGYYYLNGFFPEQLNISHTIDPIDPIDPGWWIIGGSTSELKLGVELSLVAELNSAYDIPIDHEFVFEAKILDQEIFGYRGILSASSWVTT